MARLRGPLERTDRDRVTTRQDSPEPGDHLYEDDNCKIWDVISADAQRLAQMKRFNGYIASVPESGIEDLSQLAVLHILERITANPAFLVRLQEPAVRNAYIVATLHNIARAMYRKYCRRNKLLRNASELLIKDEEDGRSKLDLYEHITWLLEHTDPAGNARLAIDVAVGSTTLQEYAAKMGVSLRTAQRHFLDGIQTLRNLAQN